LDCNSSGGIDLHVHSTASDGTLTPHQLVALAIRLNLGVLAITDHDTIDGSRKAAPLAAASGLICLTGVEISAAPPEGWPILGSIHVLGYGFDLDHPGLNDALKDAQAARLDRNPRILNLLAQLGYPLTESEVRAAAGDGSPVGRPHIALALIRRGWARDINDAFDRLLGTGKPAYVDKYRLPFCQAIDVIHAAGGVAVLAHPGLLPIDDGFLAEHRLAQLTTMGLDGIEVLYPEHSPEQIGYFQGLAARAGLVITGGTDFHGRVKPDTQLGTAGGDFFVPLSVYDRLVKRVRHAGRARKTETG